MICGELAASALCQLLLLVGSCGAGSDTYVPGRPCNGRQRPRLRLHQSRRLRRSPCHWRSRRRPARSAATPTASKVRGPFWVFPSRRLRSATCASPTSRSQPAPHWNGVHNATAWAPGCLSGGLGPTHEIATVWKQDCLYLNVFTPLAAAPGARLPVFYFFHGGTSSARIYPAG